MLGSVCVYFQADAVLIAVGICAAVTLALTLFAFQVGLFVDYIMSRVKGRFFLILNILIFQQFNSFQTKIDFTNCGGMLCALVMILCLAGLLMCFMPYNK